MDSNDTGQTLTSSVATIIRLRSHHRYLAPHIGMFQCQIVTCSNKSCCDVFDRKPPEGSYYAAYCGKRPDDWARGFYFTHRFSLSPLRHHLLHPPSSPHLSPSSPSFIIASFFTLCRSLWQLHTEAPSPRPSLRSPPAAPALLRILSLSVRLPCDFIPSAFAFLWPESTSEASHPRGIESIENILSLQSFAPPFTSAPSLSLLDLRHPLHLSSLT